MKTLSILLITCLLVLTADAQDTTKNVHRPKLNVHQLWLIIRNGPQQNERFRMREDSLIRPTLPPEVHHPAIYIDGTLGYAFLGVHGFESSAGIYYQGDVGLFAVKGLNISSFKPGDNPYRKRFLVIFDDIKTNSLDQVDFMYGKRLLDRKDQQALNFSAGIAIESRYFYYYTFQNAYVQTRYQHAATYPGVPLEVDYQLFARRFGASFNIKLSGDVSRYSFASIGVALGLGYHYKTDRTGSF